MKTPKKPSAPPPLRAILKLTYQCTSRCRFCRAEDYRGTVPDISAEEACAKLAAARDLGVEMVLFSGGEPTLRKDLPRLARVATGLGLRWGLITNGRRLAYPDYREALLGLGLEFVHTSLHGADAATHDEVVQCAGYDDILDALRGLTGHGLELQVNTVITRSNAAQLHALSDLLVPLAPLTHKLCLMEPRGLFKEHENDLLIRPEEAGKSAMDAVRRARSRHGGSGLKTVIEGFPLCQVWKERDAVENLLTNNIRYMSEAFEDGFFESDHGERKYPATCRQCARRDDCPGVYLGYVERFGASGLRALKGSSKNPRGKSPGKRRPRAG